MAAIYAHRGASREFPENTIAAFRRAVELGVPGIELDVHLSADGVPVVLHDETVDRTTSESGPVSSFTASQLAAMDAGGGEGIPTLAEVIDVVEGKVRLNIEVKAADAADAVLALVQRRPDLDWAISSFDWDVLRHARRTQADAELWPLTIGATDEAIALAQEIGATQLNLLDQAVDADIVRFLLDLGIESWIWTVNDPDRAMTLIAWGVTGICTDDPALLLDRLAASGGQQG
ncbi:MAG: glycerophosphodiester phosphodiesterase family protein [Thermomicrobiales bacterium]